MRACEACPNRWLVRLFRSIGDDEAADELEATGCNNWKALQYETKDPETGQPGEVKVVEQCMRDHLPNWFNAVSALSAEVAQTAQSQRNVTAQVGEKIAQGFRALHGEFVKATQEREIKEVNRKLDQLTQ